MDTSSECVKTNMFKSVCEMVVKHILYFNFLIVEKTVFIDNFEKEYMTWSKLLLKCSSNGRVVCYSQVKDVYVYNTLSCYCRTPFSEMGRFTIDR